MNRLRNLILSVTGVFLLITVIGASSVSAATATISRSYNADGQIPSGSLVSIERGRSNYVQPANTNNGQDLLGVAVAGNESLLEVNASSSTVQVATEGAVNTLVSTVNGPISVGDQIAVSPFDGVGMKAGPSERIIGIAQTGFNSSTSDATSEQVSEKNGRSQTLVVGYVRLSIAVGISNSSGSTLSGLQKLGYNLVGHPISDVRMIISLVVACVAVISIVTLVYSAVYGSIISIGRNPLAKYVVLRTLTSVFGMVVMIAAIASLTIYLLLR